MRLLQKGRLLCLCFSPENRDKWDETYVEYNAVLLENVFVSVLKIGISGMRLAPSRSAHAKNAPLVSVPKIGINGMRRQLGIQHDGKRP